MTTVDRPTSMASVKTLETETTIRQSELIHTDDREEGDESLILAIRALRLLEDPQAAATEAIQAFDPKANLHPDLVRLLVSSAVRHPDVAQGLIELGSRQNDDSQFRHMVHRTPSGSLQRAADGGVGRHASGLVHEISISSLLSSISESKSRRPSDPVTNEAKPGLKRRLSVLSSKKDTQQTQAPPPPRKEKISIESIKKICKANLKDTQESIERLERADMDDEFIAVAELKRRADESLGHETGKFALCLALTLRDGAQRWEATRYLMDAMVDKLKVLLSIKGRFGTQGDVGLPGQDGFGIRDCWIVLSEAERERLATEDGASWTKRLREVAQLAPHSAAKAWEILAECEKIQEALAPSQRSSEEGNRTSSDGEGGESDKKDLVKRHAMSAASPQEITDRWAFFFDLLDEEAAKRCFRELRLLRQLFNAAQVPSNTNMAANIKSKAKKALDMNRQEDDLERWLDTKWAMTAMKGFMLSKAGVYEADGAAVSAERLDRLDSAFCKVFWGCLGNGDHQRLAKEDGKQWVVDMMKVFDDRRRHDVMFRLRDVLHFMQANL